MTDTSFTESKWEENSTEISLKPFAGAEAISSILRLTGEATLLAASIALIMHFNSIVVYVACAVMIGSRMRALNNLVHEASHNSLFKSKKWNIIIGRICAAPILLSFFEYKTSHMRHHARLGMTDDPDLIRLQELGLYPFPTRCWFIKSPWKLLIFYIKYVVGSLYLSDKTSFLKRVGVLAIPFTFTLILFPDVALRAWLLCWVIPFFTTYHIIKLLAETGEHGGLYDSDQQHLTLNARSIHMTRNIVSGRFSSFFLYPHGDNFHMLHHRFPIIPGAKLKDFHDELSATGWYARVSYQHNSELIGAKSVYAFMKN
jgi:fatty acid desaturase